MNRINLLIPLAGDGKRFVDAGYAVPKPLMIVGDKTNLEWSLNSLEFDQNEVRVIFIIRKDQQLNYDLKTILMTKYPKCEVIVVPHVTKGAVETCLYAQDRIEGRPLAIFCPDIYIEPALKLNSELFENVDGRIFVFKANSKNYSYVEIDLEGNVKQTAEKQIISSYAAAGLYLFSDGSAFVEAATKMIAANETTNNEFYVCPLYNTLIADGKKIAPTLIDKIHIFGTPAEYEFFTSASIFTFPKFKTNIGLCSDHSGYDTKELCKASLEDMNIPYIDFGTFSSKDCDYIAYVRALGDAINKRTCSFGMGFCKSGQGVNVAANKIKGIRSALVSDNYTSQYAIKHNCANFFAIPSKYITTKKQMDDIILIWKGETFDGGRHQNRLQGLESGS